MDMDFYYKLQNQLLDIDADLEFYQDESRQLHLHDWRVRQHHKVYTGQAIADFLSSHKDEHWQNALNTYEHLVASGV